MYDSLSSINFPTQSQYSFKVHNFGSATCLRFPRYADCSIPNSRRSSITINSTRDRDAIPFPSDINEYEDLEFGLIDPETDRQFVLKRDQNGETQMKEPAAKSGIDEEDLSIREILKFMGQKKDNKLVKEDVVDSKFDELERDHHRGTVEVAKSRRQMTRRSNVMAKQVISIRSALCLGFVSQLWVDTTTWMATVVEVRPNLLSGDFERFLLNEIVKVGDVILVEDENVSGYDFKLVGLETLVGYDVVTPNLQSIGKVRGYTFNINSGTVESLELDSFGISIIPSSLVSTYALYVEDVLEVIADKVVVHEAAVSRIQRITKGFWDGQSPGNSNNDFEEQLDVDKQQNRAEKGRKKVSSRKPRPKSRKNADDWELPMDFL
ncbi:hypothetical protein ABFX02_10G002500 [Erythranthe guttata]